MPEWLETKTGDDNCPTCKESLQACSSEEGLIPMPGDITLCGYCGEILKFAPDMELFKLPDVIFDNLAEADKQKLLFYQTKIKELNENNTPNSKR